MKKTILVHVGKVQFIMWKVLSLLLIQYAIYMMCVYPHTHFMASLDGGGIERSRPEIRLISSQLNSTPLLISVQLYSTPPPSKLVVKVWYTIANLGYCGVYLWSQEYLLLEEM